MYAEFSYDLLPGSTPNDDVRSRMLAKFDLLPSGNERLRCDLLADTFICEIRNLDDFETVHAKLSRLRVELDQQFNYTFSLRSRNDPLRTRGTHNSALAKRIVEGR